MDLNDAKLGSRIMALLVSEHGIGKSGIAASFYKEGPIHFFDFDGRMDGVRRLYPHVPKGSISYETYGPMKEGRIKSIIQFEKDLEALVKNCPYKTIVLDGLASMTNTSIVFQMVSRGAATVAQLPESLADKNKKDGPKETKGGIPVPSWDEFNGEAMFMCEVFDICKILPCNVILTSWPVTRTKIEGSNTSVKESLVTFGVKTPGMVPGYFNEIWRVIAKASSMEQNAEIKRYLLTQPYGDYIAKSSLPIPGEIEIPKISKFECACCREEYFYEIFMRLKKEGLERLNRIPETKPAA